MTITKAVIPVAGQGSRLLPLTKSQPREMLPVGRKPCVQWIVEELVDAGITDILFITGANKRTLEDHFDFSGSLGGSTDAGTLLEFSHIKPEDLPVRFYYTRQGAPVGLGDAIRCGRSFVGNDPFVVALGDTIIRSDALKPESRIVSVMIQEFESSEANIVISAEEISSSESHKYGILHPGGRSGRSFSVEDIVEKPLRTSEETSIAVAARYVFWPGIFEYLDRTIPRIGGDLQLTDAIKLAITQGVRTRGVLLSPKEKRYDVSTFDSYFRAFIEFAIEDEQYGYEMRQLIARLAQEL